MEDAQRERLGALLSEVQVAILVTQGEQWPTATMQAFAETPEFDLLFIMNDAIGEVSKSAQASVRHRVPGRARKGQGRDV